MSIEDDNDDDDGQVPSGRASPPIDGALNPLEWTGKKPRESTLGTYAPIADQTNWRKKLQHSRLKFDDVAKARYLAELERSGKRYFAARAAGVAPETVQRHINDVDPDFAEQADLAYQAYTNRIAFKIEQEGVEGVLVTKSRMVKDETGEAMEEEIHREVKFETSLRTMILKRLDPAYRENSTLNINTVGTGGVVLIPVVSSREEWMRLWGAPADDS